MYVFMPGKVRDWVTEEFSSYTVLVNGWAFSHTGLLKKEALGRHIIDMLNKSVDFSSILESLNGNFAVVVQGKDLVHIGVDTVRSIPLFFRLDKEALMVSDDARVLISPSNKVDMESAIEYAGAGYVTGPHTLFESIYGLQAGEFGTWQIGTESIKTQRYYQYTCSYDSKISTSDLCGQLDDVMSGVFSRYIETLDGRQVVVPLSGGLDSRFIAAMLKKSKYDNVLCYSYGVPRNKESMLSEKTAALLGYPWVQITYSRDIWRDAFDNPDIKEYRSFAANAGSYPFHDDWPAVRTLKENGMVSEDAVFTPGHTGDFISGDRLKYLFNPYIWDGDAHDIKGALIKKHYSLWHDFVNVGYVYDAVVRRIDEALSFLPQDTDEDVSRMFEYWEWQERQSKYIINSVRVYEFFGFAWRIPLWDRELMDFWKHVGISLKMHQYLYKKYLYSYNPLNIFQEKDLPPMWSSDEIPALLPRRFRKRVFENFKRFPGVEKMYERYLTYKRHLREWNHHPLGEAHVYGKLQYLLLDSGKRHAQSLSLRAFLKDEFAIEMSCLEREARDIINS